MRSQADLLTELRALIDAAARPDMATPIDGLLLAKVTDPGSEPEYSLTEPLVVVMAQGGKRLRLGDREYEYRGGDVLVVTAGVPITGQYVDVDARTPALGVGLVLRPEVVAALAARAPAGRPADPSALATGPADVDLLDAVVRMVRLVDRPADAAVLAPLLEQEIVWRVLTGAHGAAVRRIGLADSDLTHVSRAIGWIRDNSAEPLRIDDLARLSGMSASAFHRHFRYVTNMSPLQFQKHIRLQRARSLLAAHPGDVAGVGHRVGYGSPSQFNREYRRLFGTPPGRDSARQRAGADTAARFP